MKLLSAIYSAAAIVGAVTADDGSERVDYVPSLGSLTTQSTSYKSTPNSLDSPHVLGINPAVFEWWWFDGRAHWTVRACVCVAMVGTGTQMPCKDQDKYGGGLDCHGRGIASKRANRARGQPILRIRAGLPPGSGRALCNSGSKSE